MGRGRVAVAYIVLLSGLLSYCLMTDRLIQDIDLYYVKSL